MKADTAIELADITQLEEGEIEALLEGIRERRLKPVLVYEQLLKMTSEAKKVKLGEALEKQLGIFAKKLEKIDKSILDLEGRARKLRVIRMEIEIS